MTVESFVFLTVQGNRFPVYIESTTKRMRRVWELCQMLDDDDDLARQAKILEMQLAALTIKNNSLKIEIERLERELRKNLNQSKAKSKIPKVLMSLALTLPDFGPLVELCN